MKEQAMNLIDDQGMSISQVITFSRRSEIQG